jgi:SWI/SNF-related matrix-associated actin-dependent regulator 1 of chromatin subfamily A
MKLSMQNAHRAVLRWSTFDLPLSAGVEASVERLAELPGVRLDVLDDSAGSIVLPRSTWKLDDAQALFAECNDAPQLATAPALDKPVPLYPHQEAAIEFLVENRGGILADEMGLGKTRSALVAARRLAGSRPVVICGPRYTRKTWEREIAGLGMTGGGFWAVEGTRPHTSPKRWEADWVFVHYEIAAAWAGTLRVNQRPPAVLILDEAHWARNGRTQRGKAAALIGHVAQTVICLTGTPLANRPSELWALLHLVDGPFGFGGPLEYRQRYCGATHDGYGWRDTSPTRTSELSARLSTRYLRRTLADVPDLVLPGLRRMPLLVELDDVDLRQQQEILDAHKLGGLDFHDLYELIVHGNLGEDTLSAFHALRNKTSEAKLGTTVEFVQSLVAQDQSVVVFAWQRAIVERLVRGLKRLEGNAYMVHGGRSQAEREATVDAFTRDPNPAVLVSTLDALKEGVTLTKATRLVLHDLSWVPSDVLQAEARVHRIGQTRPCTSTWVLARDSFDVLLAEAFVRKVEVQRSTLGIVEGQNAAHEVALEGDFLRSLEDEGARLLAAWKGRAQ